MKTLKMRHTIFLEKVNPLKSQTEFFWDEILERKICYILSFCSYIPNSTNGQYNDCWSLSSKSIGDYFIENISSGTVEEMNMRYIEYCFSNKSKSTTHTVKIFQCSEWKINDIPQSITCFINLYSFLCNEIKENSLLVHSLYLPDSRVSVFISFAYIVESMLNNENTNDPMKIVKISKDQGHCGPLTKIDFAFLLRSVIEYFVKRNKLYIGRNMKIFNENYNNFIKKTHGKFIINDKKFYHFFNYANTLTKEKIRSYCGIENKICLFEEEDMKRKCSKFYKILNFQNKEKEFNPTSARKAIRYDNIPCFDEYLACYYRRNIDINDLVDNFVHANELAYLHINDIIRRIIICQASFI
uniref:Tyrosine-protein phosphatase domain-containing protein n=1 Tax=Parastrongyloides trichosuri TaxID=131310 RepID=A0A0N5A594_PARTI